MVPNATSTASRQSGKTTKKDMIDEDDDPLMDDDDIESIEDDNGISNRGRQALASAKIQNKQMKQEQYDKELESIPQVKDSENKLLINRKRSNQGMTDDAINDGK